MAMKLPLTHHNLYEIFDKAPKNIGYTEVYYPSEFASGYFLKEYAKKQGYNIRWFTLTTTNYNFNEQKNITKETHYIVWNEFPYFYKLLENNPMEERIMDES